ncbi:MAG: zf-HC2 domain-containing protein [Planctomycetaceae bacterium]
MDMSCREIQHDLALFVGGDLDDAGRVRELKSHLGGCADCRRHYRGLKSSLVSLTTVDQASTWVPAISLWSKVEKSLAKPPESSLPLATLRQLKHWTPFAAAAAACMLMLLVLNPGDTEPTNAGRRSIIGPPSASLNSQDMPAPQDRSESESVSGRLVPPDRL